jgi:long-chain acyl-CoA synthetase
MGEVGISWDEAVAQVTAPGAPFALTEATIRGNTYRVFENAPPSLRHLWDGARRHGARDFLVYEDERLTFTDVMTSVDALGAALVDRYEIGTGDRVAIAMRNYPEFVISVAAITSVGAIAVCLNAWWTTEELEYGLTDCGARVLIADDERIERIEPVLDAIAAHPIVVRPASTVPDGVERWDEVVVAGAAMPDVDIEPDDDAIILYTSGTTGFPKGAVSTHRAVLSAIMAYGSRAIVNRLTQPGDDLADRPDDAPPTSFILVVPLFHVTGLVPVMMSCFASGYKLVMTYKWDPERALELIERERITQFVGVPTMSWDLLESPDFGTRDTTSLASVGGGGAPAPPELVKRVDQGFTKGRPGIGYGMTETTAYGPQNSGDDYLRKPSSAGRVIPVMEIRVIDESGQSVPTGEVGEICFRGPNVIRGYWNKPEATADTIDAEGWLRSGDLGRLDDEGFIFVEDRAKDMVLRAGENVYCAEVEAALYQHPAVYEAAVFGLPHERLGEEVAAAILPKAGMSIDPDDLRTHLAQHLARFKIPTHVEFVSEQLPRGATGKILKRTIRDDIVAQRG